MGKASGHAESGLTHQQERFVEEYLIHLNASRAALNAGYTSADSAQRGCYLLRNPLIRARIAARLSEIQMEAAEVHARLTQQARGAAADTMML